MQLTLTNNGQWAVPVISTDDDGYAESLEPNYPLQVDNDDVLVLIVGNKPSVTEQIEQAAGTLADFVKDIVSKWQQANNQATSADESNVRVGIKNDGENAVRCILGDGVTDTTIEPGATYDAQAWGYVELRELGHVPQSDDPPNSKAKPLPEALAPCLGVMCEKHQTCARYAMIDGSSVPSHQWIAFCAPAPPRPGYEPLAPEET